MPLSAQTILVHAHRGGRAYRPENTLPSFQYGIEVGADVLELDLAVTRDNVLVVSHSPFLTQPAGHDPASLAGRNERTCDGPPLPPGTLIRSLTLAQLKQYDCGLHPLAAFPHQIAVPHSTIPTFDEVLALAPQGHFDFNVETKIFPSHPEITPSPEVFVAMIDDAVRRLHLQSRVILQSFDFRTLRAMRKIDPAIRLSALFEPADSDAIMGPTDHNKSFPHILEVTGADLLSPDQSLITPEAVAQAHQLGKGVAPFTINTPQGWQKMADARRRHHHRRPGGSAGLAAGAEASLAPINVPDLGVIRSLAPKASMRTNVVTIEPDISAGLATMSTLPRCQGENPCGQVCCARLQLQLGQSLDRAGWGLSLESSDR